MSNAKIDFLDDHEALGREAIQEVRSDKTDTDWVLFTYESPKSQKIKLGGKGSGGVSELCEHLSADQVGYALVRKTDQIDDSVTVKFAFINFVGEKVPIMQRARISIHKSPMKDFIGQHHVDHTTSSLDELTDAIILEKVQITSGTASRVLDSSGAKQGVTSSQSRATGGSAVTPKKSGDLSFDLDAIKEGFSLIRSDPPAATWMLASYDGPNSNHVVRQATGTGDVAELVAHLKDDMVGYALVRKTEQFEMSETVKFVFIRFVGDNINRMLRARLGTHLGAVQTLFHPYHVALEASTPNEVSEEILAQLISNASGTANKVLDDVAALSIRQQQSTGPTTVRTSGAPGASTPASQTAPKPKPTYGGAPAPNVPKSVSSGHSLKFTDESALRNAIADVRSDATDTDWVLFGYEGGKGNTITLLGSGTGGVAALVSHLADDIVGYGLVRKVDQVDDSLTVKFCFINFQGENIDRMHRARLGTHKGEVEALATPYHVDILASQRSELTDDIVLTKIQETSGTKSRVKA
eukprot:TRINITY_DN7607_c0_g2_i1.p1 TRINITY_DN7607_c0_g2~~TRINITY_DN7607_c0_g2_i1.p1  ORF type:complete len:541 (+),score=182.19 TRINITY_DN7607_c0_g2_i1:50-1624(+)